MRKTDLKPLDRILGSIAAALAFVFLVGAVFTGGTSGINAEVDATSKALRVSLYGPDGTNGGVKISCSLATGSYTPPATPTDSAGICGSGSKTIRVYNVRFSGVATAVTNARWILVKRSTADTAGTLVSDTVVSHDSNDACTATGGHYTANPTTGTLVGNVRSDMATIVPAAAAFSATTQLVHEFFGDSEWINTKGVTLRGTAQCLYINFAGAALPAGSSWSSDWTWAEE